MVNYSKNGDIYRLPFRIFHRQWDIVHSCLPNPYGYSCCPIKSRSKYYNNSYFCASTGKPDHHMKKDIIIIGAGGVGRVVAFKCAQQKDTFGRILLASRTKSKCDEIKEAIGDDRITTAAIDAMDRDALVKLITDFGAQLVIHVAVLYQDLAIMDACLEAGVHYLDTANYEPEDEANFEYKWQWAYHDRYKEAGIMVLLGSGFDPGVTSVFTAYAAKHYFDEIQYLDIVDCYAGDHGDPFATNFNPEINIREVTQKGKYWENGQWVETEPHQFMKKLNYPGIGPRNSYL